MGVKSRKYYVVCCDVCGYEFENENGGIQCFVSKDEARQTIKGCDWTIKNGKIRCHDCYEQP